MFNFRRFRKRILYVNTYKITPKKPTIKLPASPRSELVNAVVMPDNGLYMPACMDCKTDSSEKFNDAINSAKPPTVKINPQNVPSNPKNIKIFVM